MRGPSPGRLRPIRASMARTMSALCMPMNASWHSDDGHGRAVLAHDFGEFAEGDHLRIDEDAIAIEDRASIPRKLNRPEPPPAKCSSDAARVSSRRVASGWFPSDPALPRRPCRPGKLASAGPGLHRATLQAAELHVVVLVDDSRMRQREPSVVQSSVQTWMRSFIALLAGFLSRSSAKAAGQPECRNETKDDAAQSDPNCACQQRSFSPFTRELSETARLAYPAG